MLSQTRLHEIFDYIPSSGRLSRKNCTINHNAKPVTEGMSKQGYFMRWVDKKCYAEHALVFMYHYGYIPEEIDHRNHIKTDNRIENLRACDRTHNNGNLRKRKGKHSSTYKGVSYHKGASKWVAQISKSKTHYHLGLFATQEEAAVAYNKKALELYGEFAALNEVIDANS